MKRVTLTDDSIATFRYKGGTDYRWDAQRVGFGVRVYPSGRSVYVVAIAGKIQVLGPCRGFTVDQARDAAVRAQQRTVDAQFLARAVAPLTPVVPLASHTVDELAEAHPMWARASKKKPGWAKDIERRYREGIQPQWGSRELSTITTLELMKWHGAQSHRKVWANRALDVFAGGWKLAIKWKWVAPYSSPFEDYREWRWKEKPRKRVLSPEEAVRVRNELEAMAATGKPRQLRDGAQGIKLILLTGMRHQEAASNLVWRGVDLDAGTLTIWDHKNSRRDDEAKVIELPPQAVALLRARQRGRPGDRVFGLRTFYVAWREVRRLADAPDVVIHDLRRTLATRLKEAGVDSKVIADLLGQHTVQITDDVYVQTQKEFRRSIAKKAADLMTN